MTEYYKVYTYANLVSLMDAGTSKNVPFVYKQSFEQERADVLQLMYRWQIESGDFAKLNLDGFESLILIKNAQRVITFDNANFRRFIMAGRSAEGLRSEQFLSPHVAKIALAGDQMILDGVLSIEAEHLAAWEGNRTVIMTSYKKRLDDLKNPACTILMIARAKDFVRSTEFERRLSLNEALVLLKQLDEKDRRICNGLLAGDSTKETADSVGMTPRAVELRRQRILDLFGFERPIEIVKLLVRLEESGLISDKI